MNIQAKYIIDRELINNGDLALFRGDDMVDKAIQVIDKAYYSHVGMVWKANNRYLICDATAGRGVNIDFLSTRIRQEVDFRILRVDTLQKSIDFAVDKALKMGDEHYGYNYAYIVELAIKKVFNLNVNISEHHAFICSIFMKKYVRMLGMKENFITPEDYIRIPNSLKTIIA